MRPSRFRAVSLAALALLIASPAFGQITVYNNFGPGHEGWDYDWGMGWTVAGENVPAQYGVEQAMAFTSTASGVLADIWVAFWYVPLDPQADVVTIYLARNSSGLPPAPGDVLEQWTITEFGSWSQWNPPQHLPGSGTATLAEGESYWLWAVGGPTTWCGWCLNPDPALTCPHTLRREGQGWLPIANETASAFRVDLMGPASTPDIPLASGAADLIVRPNPARSAFEAVSQLPPDRPVTMRLVDVGGRVASEAVLPGANVGERSWRVDASRLPRGVYFVVAEQSGSPRLARKVVLAP